MLRIFNANNRYYIGKREGDIIKGVAGGIKEYVMRSNMEELQEVDVSDNHTVSSTPLTKYQLKEYEQALEILKEAKEKYKDKKFHEAENFDKACFYDLIQEMINNGHKIHAFEIDSGWSEVYTFEDYKRISQILSGK